MKETHSDRRVRKSKQALQDALLSLIPQKGYDGITIQDIADEADTARVTFYRHYKDKDELLLDALDSVRLSLIAQIEDVPPGDRLINPPVAIFYRYIQEHEELFRVLFGNHGAMLVVNQVRDYFAELLEGIIRIQVKDKKLHLPIEIMAQSAASAHVGLAIWWLEHDFPYPADYMAATSRWILFKGQGAAMQLEPLNIPVPQLDQF